MPASNVAHLTIRRAPPGGLGDKYPITVSLDGAPWGTLRPGEALARELAPGRYRLRVYNTLVWKNLELELAPGDQVGFVARNRAGPGTELLALLGAGPLYLAVERETPA